MRQIDYAHKIRVLRIRKMTSQLELEVNANLSHGMVSRLETGRVNPSKETLTKIAVALKLNAQETANLFGITEIVTGCATKQTRMFI